MLRKIEDRTCLTCGQSFKGRSDKKFCNDYCRNTYNNQLNADANTYVRNINSILRRNRRILEELLTDCEDGGRVKRDKLLQRGFNFHYFTHISHNGGGQEYKCCYEYGYIQLDAQTHLINKIE